MFILGYDTSHFGYHSFHVPNNRVYISRHVLFNETIFFSYGFVSYGSEPHLGFCPLSVLSIAIQLSNIMGLPLSNAHMVTSGPVQLDHNSLPLLNFVRSYISLVLTSIQTSLSNRSET